MALQEAQWRHQKALSEAAERTETEKAEALQRAAEVTASAVAAAEERLRNAHSSQCASHHPDRSPCHGTMHSYSCSCSAACAMLLY